MPFLPRQPAAANTATALPPHGDNSSLSIPSFLCSSSSSSSASASSCLSSASTQLSDPFSFTSLCFESEDERRLLVSAGLWSHYQQSIAALTQTFRHFMQRTLAAYKQLSRTCAIDSAEVQYALSTLSNCYVSVHGTALTLYSTHAAASQVHNNSESNTSTPFHSAAQHPPAAKQKPRVKAVRSLSTTRSKESNRQRGKRGGRTSFPTASTGALRLWFRSHLRAPYPSDREKARLSKASGMIVEQVANWYVSTTRLRTTQQTNMSPALL